MSYFNVLHVHQNKLMQEPCSTLSPCPTQALQRRYFYKISVKRKSQFHIIQWVLHLIYKSMYIDEALQMLPCWCKGLIPYSPWILERLTPIQEDCWSKSVAERFVLTSKWDLIKIGHLKIYTNVWSDFQLTHAPGICNGVCLYKLEIMSAAKTNFKGVLQ